MQHDLLALDGVCVDCTSVISLVLPFDVSYLQIPFLDERSNDGEPEVVDDATVFVRQWNGLMIKPRHLAGRRDIAAHFKNSRRLLHNKMFVGFSQKTVEKHLRRGKIVKADKLLSVHAFPAD
jgi:hypothetical protein